MTATIDRIPNTSDMISKRLILKKKDISQAYKIHRWFFHFTEYNFSMCLYP